ITNGSIGWVASDRAGNSGAPLNALLGPLRNNGGPTLTVSPLPGSPAIDAGDDALLAAPFYLTADQRGFPRKSGTHVDIGAFEFQAASTPLQIGTPMKLGNGAFQFAFINTPGATFTVLAATNVSLPLSNWTALGAA